jgi:hypothetical protein
MYVLNIAFEGVDLILLVQDSFVRSSCEHDDEPLGFREVCSFLGQLSDSQLLDKDSALWG